MERGEGGFVIRITDFVEILIRHLKLSRITHNLGNSRRRRIGIGIGTGIGIGIGVEIRVRVMKMIGNERVIEIRVRVNRRDELLLLRWLLYRAAK